VNSERVIELFNEATGETARGTRGFPGGVLPGPARVRQQLERLLRANRRRRAASSNSRRPGMMKGFPALVTEKPGDKIGHYKLLEQIGEGGCWPWCTWPSRSNTVRRMVALKVIKLGMDTSRSSPASS